jgi:hypothetical protein
VWFVAGNFFHYYGPDAVLSTGVRHGRCVIAHNLILWRYCFRNCSEGTGLRTIFFTGENSHRSELTPHQTVDFAEVVSLLNIRGGSDRALPTFSFPA